MRDSNPRMVGPEPTALPLGESPTDYSVLVIVVQNAKKCKAPSVMPGAKGELESADFETALNQMFFGHLEIILTVVDVGLIGGHYHSNDPHAPRHDH